MSTSSSSTDPEPSPRLLEIGRITRPHGVRGELVVALTTDRTERLDVGTVLDTPHGPLTVARSRPDKDRWLVTFEEVAGREAADALRGTILSAAPLEDDDALWVHELIGCSVVSQDGVERGEVASVQHNPASDLLVLADGSLVPLTFLVGGPVDGVLRVDAPDGLFEL